MRGKIGPLRAILVVAALVTLSACATTQPELDPLPTQSIDAPPPPPPPGEAPAKDRGALPTQSIDAPPPPPPSGS